MFSTVYIIRYVKMNLKSKQDEIARLMNISRPKVSRLLSEGRQLNNAFRARKKTPHTQIVQLTGAASFWRVRPKPE